MSEKKIIAVLGATGAQGGGLVHAILNDPESEFSVRAITRNPDSENAQKLASMGVEVVTADVDNPESLKKAFDGAYGAYCVTSFWEHMSPEKETKQAKALAEATKEAGLEHVVWSTLEDTRNWVPLENDSMPTLMENYKVPHFDAKGEADHFFTELDVPVTFLHTSFYWDNLIYFGMGPAKGPDGNLYFNLPMGEKKLPGIAAEDIGKSAYGIFKKGAEYIRKRVGIAGEHLTGAEMATSLSTAFDQQIGYNPIPHKVYRGFDFPGADDLGNMFQFKHDFEEEYCNLRSVETTQSLNPSLQTFDDWLMKYKDSIPMP